ncbi:MAG: hypothetical protein J5525_08580 [Lachnospiraceae bacterium]|nr:hypothetical protein [Lachnospiraceae bacterium]
MKNVWEKYLRGILFLYFEIYTVATLINSIIYLAKGVYEDPSGNWHEIDRAVIVLVAVIAYALIRYIKVNSFLLKIVIVYVPTMLLVFLYVYLRGLTVELAKTAYRDIFINYTAGFIFVTIVVFIINKLRKKNSK